MCFVFLGYLINAYIEKRDAERAVTYEEESIRMCSTNDFLIKDLTWHVEDKDAPGIIDSMTVTNKGDYDCKDIKGHMLFLSNDGTEIGKKDFIVPDYIRSKETKTLQRIPVDSILFSSAHDVAVTLEGTAVNQEGQE
jgi:hypothetical protein